LVLERFHSNNYSIFGNTIPELDKQSVCFYFKLFLIKNIVLQKVIKNFLILSHLDRMNPERLQLEIKWADGLNLLAELPSLSAAAAFCR